MTRIPIDLIQQARERIGKHLEESRLLYSSQLSEDLKSNVYLKMESENETGSFKVRGALNKLSILKSSNVQNIVTASTGNHGAAVAFASQLLGIDVSVYVPETINSSKLKKLNSFGVEVKQIGNDGIIAETAARSFAEQSGAVYVSPYNDIDVVAGQGSIGLEIQDQLERVDRIFVSLGGGGLAGGIGSSFKSNGFDTKIVGCSPVNSPVMMESIKAGRIVDFDSKPTLSDGTAGGLEEGAVTFEICKEAIDSHIAVEESDIQKATALLNFDLNIRAEGAAGLALAGASLDIKADVHSEPERDDNIVIIICGANIDSETLKSLS